MIAEVLTNCTQTFADGSSPLISGEMVTALVLCTLFICITVGSIMAVKIMRHYDYLDSTSNTR